MNNRDDEITASFKSRYEEITFLKSLPKAIQKMLLSVDEMHKSEVFDFLVSFFNYVQGYSINTVIQIMSIWNEVCVPIVGREEIEERVKQNFGKPLEVPQKLTSLYGDIDLKSYNDIIKFPNFLIHQFHKIHDCSLRIYLMMKLQKKLIRKDNWTKNEVARMSNVSTKTVERRVKNLLDMNLILKEKVGNEIMYKLPYVKSDEFGFLLLKIYPIQKLLEDVYGTSNSEVKVYIILNYLLRDQYEGWEIDEFQSRIGLMVGKGISTVSQITTMLAKKEFIRKRTYYTRMMTIGCAKGVTVKKCSYVVM